MLDDDWNLWLEVYFKPYFKIWEEMLKTSTKSMSIVDIPFIGLII